MYKVRVCLLLRSVSAKMLRRSDKEHSYTELAELPVPKSASFQSPDGELHLNDVFFPV